MYICGRRPHRDNASTKFRSLSAVESVRSRVPGHCGLPFFRPGGQWNEPVCAVAEIMREAPGDEFRDITG